MLIAKALGVLEIVAILILIGAVWAADPTHSEPD